MGPTLGQNFFIFMQFLGKNWLNSMLVPPLGIGAPSSGKSWICHRLENSGKQTRNSEKFLLLAIGHFNSLVVFSHLYTLVLTTNISRVVHKIIPGPAGGLNKELCHLAQLMAIKGGGTHCLSLVLVSSQLGHTFG